MLDECIRILRILQRTDCANIRLIFASRVDAKGATVPFKRFSNLAFRTALSNQSQAKDNYKIIVATKVKFQVKLKGFILAASN